MLYDGDSLTFPILWAALAHGEPLHPVMSTQLLFFPEGVIYAIARVATTSIRASLVAVAYLNIILFYLGLRALAAVVVDGPAARRRLAAVVPTLLLIAEMLLERVMGVNHTTIATPFLFDSWYTGVILVGIGALAFAAHQIRGAATLSWRRRLTAAVLATGVLTATTISDPLFLVQIILPFLLVAAVLGILGRLRGPLLGWVAGPHLGAIALSLALTPLYGPYRGGSASTYVHLHVAGATAKALEADLHLVLRSAAGRVELVLMAGAWMIGLATLAAQVRRARSAPSDRGGGAPSLFVSAVAVVASASVIPLIILVGDPTPRYLLPVATFPLVALVPAFNLPIVPPSHNRRPGGHGHRPHGGHRPRAHGRTWCRLHRRAGNAVGDGALRHHGGRILPGVRPAPTGRERRGRVLDGPGPRRLQHRRRARPAGQHKPDRLRLAREPRRLRATQLHVCARRRIPARAPDDHERRCGRPRTARADRGVPGIPHLQLSARERRLRPPQRYDRPLARGRPEAIRLTPSTRAGATGGVRDR